MKKIIKTLLVVMVLAVVLTAFTGCDAVETLKGIIPSELAAMIPHQFTCSVLGHKGAEHTPCERCGEVWMESNVSLECVLNGHKMVSVTQILPTCTEDGMTSGLVCSVCGHEDAPRKVLPATGHKMIPATCEVAEYCIYCRITGAEPLGHTPVDVPAVAPTCSSVGYTAGQVCGVCDKVLNGFEEIAKDPAAHGAAVEIPALAPTCSTPGHTAGTGCEYCGTAFTGCEEIAIDPDAHYFVSGLCAICQKVFEYGVGDNTRVALDTLGVAQDGSLFEFVYFAVTEAGHYKISGQNIITSIFTLDASGNTVFVNPLVDLNNPLTWGEAYLEPGYYVLGLNYYAGAGEYTFNIAKVDCTNTEEVTKAPTCTETGLKTTTCTVCGHVVEGVEVPVADHKDENGDFKCDAGCGAIVEPAADSVLTIEQALALGSLKTTTNKYYVTATVKNIYNTFYGNMWITDGTNEICVYGTKSADGTTSYDKLSKHPVPGDVITVYGNLSPHEGSGQFKDAWLIDIKHEHSFSEATCKVLATCACGETTGELADHEYVEGTCKVCGEIDPDFEGEVSSVVLKADFNTISNTTGSYVTSTTASGWKATNCAIMGGGTSDSNPKFKVFGDASTRAITLNGKTSAKGKLVSPVLADGVKSISFKYTNVFTDKNGVDITITIKDKDGKVLTSKRLDDNNVTQKVAKEFTWVLETPVTGEFVIEITNNSPSNSSSSNKDRVSIWEFQWTTNPTK